MLHDFARVRLAVLALAFTAIYGAAEAQTATLTITNNGVVSGAVGVQGLNGNVCNPNAGGGPGSGTCVYVYPVNTPLRIAANSPNHDAGFLHDGTGDTAGCAHSTCNIILTTDSSITATFDASQGLVASIHTTLLGDGTGRVFTDNGTCQNFELGYNSCTTYYAVGSEVRFQGESTPGNIFESFSAGVGDTFACGASSPCVFSATVNSSVNATFSAMASVAVVPNAPSVNVGNNTSLNASATFTNGMTRNGFGGNSNWFSHVPMDVARFSLAASVVDNKLYAIGGVDGICSSSPCGFHPLNTVEEFNPLVTAIAQFDQAWTPRAPMLTEREGLATAVVDGKIYALGGHTVGGGPVSSMEYYDPSTNTWSVGASMSAPRAGMAAAVIGNTIYVVGGSNNVGGDPTIPEATVEAYDANANTWSPRALMLTARTGAGAAAVNGILYVIGGDGAGTVEAFDGTTWTARTSMPAGGGESKAVALNGLIYAIGSGGTVQVYNPATDSWATLNPNIPASATFNQVGLAVLDGRLFAGGGLSSTNTAVKTFSAFRPPETTWWSNNSAVGRINPGNFGSVAGVAVGTATISARLVGVDSGAQSATLTVTSGGGGGGGGSTISLGIPTDPTSPPGPATFTNVGNPNWGCGTFGQNADGPWEVKINYGEGGGDELTNYFAPPAPCGGGPGTKGWFNFNHAYTSPGVYPVTVVVRNTATNASTTLTFHVGVNDGGGGGDDGCAQLISNFTVIGSVPFNMFHVKFFDRTTNELLFETDAPFVLPEDAAVPEGSFRIELSVPEGYMITPSIFSVDAVCGTPIHLDATIQAIPVVPPTIALSLSPNVIWPPNNQMVTVTATIVASSPNGHATTVQLVSLTSDGGADEIAGASIGTDDRAFDVRARKDRTYTATYRATDTSTGLSATASATVVVPHDQGK